MATTPDPIRSTVMAKLRELLSGVTVKHLYTYDVGAKRVFMRDLIGPNVEVPALFVIQRTERVTMRSTQRHKDRILLVNIGFCAQYGGPDPDEAAGLFIADIQSAIPYTADISVHVLEDPTTAVFDQITFTEIGNAINIGEPIPDRVYGQVDFSVKYTTSYNNPRFI